MGNHNVGQGMSAAAKAYFLARKQLKATDKVSKEEALAVLDLIAEPFRGADAEFDDADFPHEPLGQLIIIAFGWKGGQLPKNATDKVTETFYEKWCDFTHETFSKRYEFC